MSAAARARPRAMGRARRARASAPASAHRLVQRTLMVSVYTVESLAQ